MEKSIKQKISLRGSSLRFMPRLRFAMLEINLFLLDYGGILLVHYILAKWEKAVCDPITMNMGAGGYRNEDGE